MKLNLEVKKVVKQLKDAQEQLRAVLKDKDIVNEARKYAEKQKGEISKLLASDLTKVKKFIEVEKKNLEKIQKQLPSELERFSKLLKSLTTKGKKKVRRATMGRGKKKSAPRAASTSAAPSSSSDTASS